MLFLYVDRESWGPRAMLGRSGETGERALKVTCRMYSGSAGKLFRGMRGR